MRKVFILSTAAALALALVSTELLAQRPGGPQRGPDGPRVGADGPRDGARRGPGRFGGPFGGGALAGVVGLRGLDLTDEQRTQVQTIATESREKAAPVTEELRAARQALRQAIFADSSNDAAVKEVAAKVTELERQLTDIRISTSTAIAGVLTPEQRETLRDGTGPGRGANLRGGPGRGPGRGPARGPAGISS